MKSDLMDIVFFKKFLEDKGCKENTIYTYVITIEYFLKGNPDIDEIEDYNRFLIDNVIKKRNYQYYYIIKKFIEWKIEDRKTKDKLIEGLVKPIIKQNIKRERVYLEKDKIYEMINCIKNEKHQILAWIQAETGVRASDILTLVRGSIHPEVYENEEILKLKIVGKRDKQNVVTIFNKDLQNIILKYTNSNIGSHEKYYFVDEIKTTQTTRGDFTDEFKILHDNYVRYWRDLKQACNTVGLDFKDYATHDFRRGFARRVWDKTKDLVMLQRMLNHADPRTTIRYLEQSGMTTIDMHKEMQK